MTVRTVQIADIISLLTAYKTEAYPTQTSVDGINSSSTKCLVYPKFEFMGDNVMDEETFVVQVQATSEATLETAINLIRSLQSGHPTTGYNKTTMTMATRTADDSVFFTFTFPGSNLISNVTAATEYATMNYVNPTFSNQIMARFNALSITTPITNWTVKVTAQGNGTITGGAYTIYAIFYMPTNVATLLNYEGYDGSTLTEKSSGDYDGTTWVAATTYSIPLVTTTTVINLSSVLDCWIQGTAADQLPIYRTNITLDGTVDFTATELPFYLEFRVMEKNPVTFKANIECKARWAL